LKFRFLNSNSLQIYLTTDLSKYFFPIYAYFIYWLKKEDRYSLQAPFIASLYQGLKTFLKDPSKQYPHLENVRQQLLNDPEILEIEDYGEGSKKLKKQKFRKTSAITKHSTTSQKFSKIYQFFCSLTPALHVLELGTCVGINTLYLDKVVKGDLFTFEGAKALWLKAQQYRKSKNTTYILGDIREKLPLHLEKHPIVDFALIDATHNYQGTTTYFNMLLPYLHEESIIIIADIHWSKEMELAWKEIKKHQSVSLSLDLYECGVLFFKNGLAKSHYILSI
jgi:predicted O-methyltransferase YrrM